MSTSSFVAYVIYLLLLNISCSKAAPFVSNDSTVSFRSATRNHVIAGQSINRPFRELDDNHAILFGRATSQDPSCPDGFLCVQESCPNDITCPEGTGCFNFEGKITCGVQNQQVCALNPTTFEAVGCSNGWKCCHGNCYTPDAVCCDFPTIQCDVGTLCNACDKGKTCGNNECRDSPMFSTSLSTSSAASRSTSSTSRPASSATSPPISSMSRPPTTSVAEPSTIHSTAPPKTTSLMPQVVQSVGSFSNIGCFDDSTTSRVLVVDSQVDQSANGMTVERCVEFAQKGAFQYAGVEFGGECYVGNTLHGASLASQADCSEACAGNAAELCGSGNRIQIYQDSSWFDPTAEDLANVLQEYNETLTQVFDAISAYNTHIAALQQALQQFVSQGSGSNTQVIEEIELKIMQDHSNLNIAQQIMAKSDANRGVLFLRGGSTDVKRSTGPLVTQEIQTEATTATNNAANSISDVASLASDDVASISASSTAPLIDFSADIAKSNRALTVVGLPFSPEAAAATGVFLVIVGLFSLFVSLAASNPSGPTMTPTNTMTATISTTSTSTTQSSTATSTPVLIITNINTTQADFDKLVSSLPQDDRNMDSSFPDIGILAVIAFLNQSFAESLTKNPIIGCMTTENFARPLQPPGASPSRRRDATFSVADIERHASRQEWNTIANISSDSKIRRQATTFPQLNLQRGAPVHLRWLSRVDNPILQPETNQFSSDYLFRQPVQAQVVQPNIYVLDTGIFTDHQEFTNRIVGQYVSPWMVQNFPAERAVGLIDDTSGHGTGVASIAAGTFSGAHKTANIVPVKISFAGEISDTSCFSVFQGLSFVMSHVQANAKQGKAVIALAYRFDPSGEWFDDSTIFPTFTDMFEFMLPLLENFGITVVAGSGNDRIKGSFTDDSTPQNLGGLGSSLIVVGACGSTNHRLIFSEAPQPGRASILSFYAYGDLQLMATLEDTNLYIAAAGTSFAAAQTAGVAAYLLSQPAIFSQVAVQGTGLVPFNLKNFIISKIANVRTLSDEGQPLLSNLENIPCIAPNNPTAAQIPLPVLVDDLTAAVDLPLNLISLTDANGDLNPTTVNEFVCQDVFIICTCSK